jgi:hypothetical protein
LPELVKYKLPSSLYITKTTETHIFYRANSGLQKTEEGLTKYMDLGIPAAKLVLGVPWYGYNYECINLAEVI